ATQWFEACASLSFRPSVIVPKESPGDSFRRLDRSYLGQQARCRTGCTGPSSTRRPRPCRALGARRGLPTLPALSAVLERCDDAGRAAEKPATMWTEGSQHTVVADDENRLVVLGAA